MCGICGIIDFNGEPVHTSSIRKMMQIIKHRGPDDEGEYLKENVGLGFVRLSIIDLSKGGHQPMISEDKRYVIVFNGEIYNYIELRHELISKGHVFKTNSDTEVLLVSYIEWKEKCQDKFNGMWAFAIFDRFEKTIFCSRDRYGIKPFYYFRDNSRFIFGSEIPPILSIIEHSPEPNEQAIYDYLVFNRTDQDENTFFKGIKKLQHGHQLTIQNSDIEITKWYDLKSNLKDSIGSPESFKEIFNSAIGQHLRSDVSVGVCLSGGLDSSSIVSVLLHEFKKADLKTFSAVYGKEIIGDESEYIDYYKASVDNMFYVLPKSKSLFDEMSVFVKVHGEPVPSTSIYAQYKVMELASKHVVVTLDGQGADEELAGYHYFFGFYFKELLKDLKINVLLNEALSYIQIHKSIYAFQTLLYFLLPDLLKNNIINSNKGYIQNSFSHKYSSSSNITRNLYSSSGLNDALLDHFEYKLEHLLKWEDRNSMAFSIEARIPFLDYRLVEYTLSLPSEKLIRNGTTKYILREAMEGIVPEQIRNRSDKIGFGTPEDNWFKEKQFYDYLENLLLKSDSPIKSYINTQVAWEKYLKHLKGNVKIGKEIWKWINLDLWLKEFICNKSQSKLISEIKIKQTQQLN